MDSPWRLVLQANTCSLLCSGLCQQAYIQKETPPTACRSVFAIGLCQDKGYQLSKSKLARRRHIPGQEEREAKGLCLQAAAHRETLAGKCLQAADRKEMSGFVLRESSRATWLTSFVVSLWQGSITDEYFQSTYIQLQDRQYFRVEGKLKGKRKFPGERKVARNLPLFYA
ncbi:hypothetical protein K438DRAFT_1787059 [Mycena galopus ATCC 62051]|nr:hypothetical protein K438DRAFT_1787059 [Mycena galopus ATCC 62051]